MRRKWSMIGACALVGLVAAGAWLYGQQTTRPVEDRATVFSGKVVYVETNNGFSLPLSDARIKEFGGRSFVGGKAVGDIHEAGIYAGATVWLPVIEVARMSEFADSGHLRSAKVPPPPYPAGAKVPPPPTR